MKKVRHVYLLLLVVVAMATAEAPYPATGWRPSGQQFHLPTRQSTSYYGYGYGPPPPSSAAPSTTTTEAETTTTTELPTTTAKVEDRSGALSEGVYYVLQPGGRLQRFTFAQGPAPARLQQPQGYHYHDLEPLGAPIFSYATPQLVRLN